jgi:hypothetical protein
MTLVHTALDRTSPPLSRSLASRLVWTAGLAIVLSAPSLAASTGADVTVHDLYGSQHWGSEGSTHAYSVGTIACNQGTEPVSWCDDSNDGCLPGATTLDHPVIGQHLYRLKDGRFEQIGMSWLKHGFSVVATSSAGCGDGTCSQSLGERDHLEVGCTDAYSATQNGIQSRLGLRSAANPTTGEHLAEPIGGIVGTIDERLQVEAADIDPGLNPGARYWIEGHYVARDDAADGNALNNTSYREVSFDIGTLELLLVGETQRQQSAIAAWQSADPEVEILAIDLPDHDPVERFHAARRVSFSEGTWHYEYVLHNLNSDRGARGFGIRFPGSATITDIGFRDVDYHSGEIYDVTDWSIETDPDQGTVDWATDSYAFDEHANALRWGTLYSFWFDSDQPPEGAIHTLELFKPGAPTQVDTVLLQFPDATFVFLDGFELGDASAWSSHTD